MMNHLSTHFLLPGMIALAVIFGFILSCQNGSGQSDFLPSEFISTLDPHFDHPCFHARRQNLSGKVSGEAVLISAAAGDDFYYLTGLLDERRAIALIDFDSDKPFALFMLPRRPMATLWDGERIGLEGAVEIYHADAAYSFEEYEDKLADLLAGKKSVSFHQNDRLISDFLKTWRNEDKSRKSKSDLAPALNEMRVVKDQWETAHLEKAAEVTSLAHKRVLQTARPGQYEYDVQAEIEYVFKRNGLSPGFSTIVGSGANAAVLHYPGKNRQLQDGDLLLMDIGAASRGYTADVTRTIPVSGTFTPEQKELYELVLNAMEAAIDDMVPGNRILDPHHTATKIIVDGLHEIGLITDPDSWWQRRFYIHYRNTHYIGLHVHDVGSYGDFNEHERDTYIVNPEVRGREILPGMVMTIEPGIYLIADRLDHLHELFGDMASEKELDAFAEAVRPVYEKYAGIGIRIEDDVLITEEGNIVLSALAPKTVEEIEGAMKR